MKNVEPVEYTTVCLQDRPTFKFFMLRIQFLCLTYINAGFVMAGGGAGTWLAIATSPPSF